MKRTLLLTLSVLCIASFAFAQTGGHVGLYSDTPGYSDCNLTDAMYVEALVYVVHSGPAESNTSQFMVQDDWTGPIVGGPDYVGNLILGDIYSGITITYVGCKTLPYLLAILKYTPLAVSPACTEALSVVPDPALASGEIEIVDCDSAPHFGSGGKLTVNGNAIDCPCDTPATENTNWSKVKALYK